MPAPKPAFRRLPEAMRRRLEVATAMAWEALAEAHVKQALEFIALFEDRLSLEDALNRYVREMDIDETMGVAVRTRVLVTVEDELPTPSSTVSIHTTPDAQDLELADEGEGWRRFRPDVVMRGVIERQRNREETERLVELAIARAEEAVIKTHVDNAITFAALLEDAGALSRAVEQYLAALNVAGGRGQSVLQRTMARLADAHLPRRSQA